MQKVALVLIYKVKYLLLTFSEKALRWLKNAFASIQSLVNCNGKPHSLQYYNCSVCHHCPKCWLGSPPDPFPFLIHWIA